jgi:hypothetical protein
MKLLLTLSVSLLLQADVIITKYNVVNFHGKPLKHVTMEIDNKDSTKRLYYLDSFELCGYELIKCNKKEGICLVEKDLFEKGLR